jgi:hypothetical protein
MAVYYFIVKPSTGGICHGAVGKRCKRCVVVLSMEGSQENHVCIRVVGG